jgi:hypothetical protein
MQAEVGWPVRKTQNAKRNGGQSGLASTQYAIRNTQYAIRNTQYAKAGQSGLDVRIAIIRSIRNTQYVMRIKNTQYAKC